MSQERDMAEDPNDETNEVILHQASPPPAREVKQTPEGFKEDDDQYLPLFEEAVGQYGAAMIASTRKAFACGLRAELRFSQLSYSVELPQGQVETCGTKSMNALLCLCKKQKTVRKTVLRGLSGTIRAGSLTLVLGAPGSGKTSFLKALAGRLPKGRMRGKIKINGMDTSKENLYNLTSYIDQTDNHLYMLTVRETFAFAEGCTSGCSSRKALDTSRAELMMNWMGLSHVAETIVGDNLHRGVSGGQRRRVTVGEKLVAPKPIFLCDEISTGLDAATTYQIVRGLKLASNPSRHGYSFVVSLLQPSPQVFDLFDDVILLSKGQIAYHGPRGYIMEYFQSLGFEIPWYKDKADFLQDICTPAGQAYAKAVTPGSPGMGGHPRNAQEFVTRWEESKLCQEQRAYLREPNPKELEPTQDMLSIVKRRYANSLCTEFAAVLYRQWIMTRRDSAFRNSRLASTFVVSILLGWLNLDLDPSDGNTWRLFYSMFFFLLSIVAVGGVQATTQVVIDRAVFYKHRDENFLRPINYVLSIALTSFPLDFVLSLEAGLIVFLLAGLFRYYTFGRFCVMIFSIFGATISLTGLFKLVGSSVPDVAAAAPVNGVLVVIQIVFAGFVITYNLIKPGWIWAYWLTPLSWGFRNLSINHFHSAAYTLEEGNAYLRTMGMGDFTDDLWILWGFIYMVASMIVNHTLSAVMYKFFTMSKQKVEIQMKYVPIDEFTKIDMSDKKDALSALPFRPTTLSFLELSYFVPHPADKRGTLQLLRKVNGFALPGRMCALMGESGAGKTTLMDVLAGRKTLGKGSYITGKILFNGHEIPKKVAARVLGYVEQNDIHTPTATVREALQFSARLRLPQSVPLQARYAFVEQVISLLDLDNIAHSIIGTPGSDDGISLEQRKRVTCGVELVANPAVIFLDEPTSGLDSQAALIVMKAMRAIAATGRTVVCTIHQPSTEIFNLFDDLLLLQRGGEVVYFQELGKHSQNLIDYFQSFPETEKIQPNINPADWMLNVLAASAKAKDDDKDEDRLNFHKRYLASQMCANARAKLKELEQPTKGDRAPTADDVKMLSSWQQLPILLQKGWLHNWRSPSYTYTRQVFYIFVALFYGTTFMNLGLNDRASVQSRMGFVYSSTVFSGLVSFNTVVPVISDIRTVFYRERAAQTYDVMSFSWSLTMTEIPYVLITSLVFTVIVWFMVPLNLNQLATFGSYWIFIFSFYLCQLYLGQLFAVLFPDQKTAATAGAGLMMMWNLFCGFLVPYSQIPDIWKWVYWMNCTQYTVQSLFVNQFYCDYLTYPEGCPSMAVPQGSVPDDPEATEVYVWQYVETAFDVNKRMQWWNLLILWGFIIVFVAARAVTLMKVSYLSR